MKKLLLLLFAVVSSASIVAQPKNEFVASNKNPSYSYQVILESCKGFGFREEYGMDNFKINLIKSIINNGYFSIGLGTGFQWYNEYKYIDFEHSLIGDPNQIPVFIDIRTTFKNNKLVPYLAMRIGNSFQFWADYKIHNEGMLLGIFAGLRIRVFERHAIMIGISYDSQKMLIWADANKFSEVNAHITSKSLGINFGISF